MLIQNSADVAWKKQGLYALFSLKVFSKKKDMYNRRRGCSRNYLLTVFSRLSNQINAFVNKPKRKI
jgi:hypothetical protein